uniref:Uncharacterized protein n=1 Tax=Anopheles maculatus TaxID=74869 RepID=A0A182ST24_9DIPT
MLHRLLRALRSVRWKQTSQPPPSTLLLTRSLAPIGHSAFDFHFQAHPSALSTIGTLVDIGTVALETSRKFVNDLVVPSVADSVPRTKPPGERYSSSSSCTDSMLSGAKILSGTDVAKEIRERLKKDVAEIRRQVPTLVPGLA